jgi:hypothetical protein
VRVARSRRHEAGAHRAQAEWLEQRGGELHERPGQRPQAYDERGEKDSRPLR